MSRGSGSQGPCHAACITTIACSVPCPCSSGVLPLRHLLRRDMSGLSPLCTKQASEAIALDPQPMAANIRGEAPSTMRGPFAAHSPPRARSPDPADPADPEKTELSSSGNAPTAVLEKWNHPSVNRNRYFATVFGLWVMGMNDACLGALLPRVRTTAFPWPAAGATQTA